MKKIIRTLLATLVLFSTVVFTSPKTTVVLYWATYCSYCKAEIPILNDIADRYPNVRVIGVATDGKDKPYKVKEIIRKYRPHFPLDSTYRPPEPIYGVPSIFIIKDGKVVKVFYRSTASGEIDRYL